MRREYAGCQFCIALELFLQASAIIIGNVVLIAAIFARQLTAEFFDCPRNSSASLLKVINNAHGYSFP